MGAFVAVTALQLCNFTVSTHDIMTRKSDRLGTSLGDKYSTVDVSRS